MSRPPNLANLVLTALVWLSLPLIAALALVLPLHRLLAPNWPPALIEWIDATGRIELRPSDLQVHDDAVVRSRPLHAARAILRSGESRFGYVVGLRIDDEQRTAPSGRWWQPDGDCAVGLAEAGRAERVEWIDCAELKRLVWPNRLTLLDRVALAGRRVLDHRFGS